jgi:Lrp/AsnC family leucine-responsive transcriptional regulator
MLDEIDLRILDILQREGRISMLALAERVGLSATPCARRVKQMEDDGLIQGYVALVDTRAVGLGLTALVRVRTHRSKQSADIFENAVQRMPQVVRCYSTTGGDDYLLYVVARDMDVLSQWMREKLVTLPGVAHTETSIVLDYVKVGTALPLTETTEVRTRRGRASRKLRQTAGTNLASR